MNANGKKMGKDGRIWEKMEVCVCVVVYVNAVSDD